MAISFSGLASGMDTSSWVEALVSIKQASVDKISTQKSEVETQRGTLSTLQAQFTKLRSSIETLTDAKFGSSFDLFTKNKTSSSNENVVTAKATSDAAKQSLDIIVNRLATSTVVKSGFNPNVYINDDTKFSSLASGNAEIGTFSVYVDGVKNTVDIGEEDTIGDVLTKISDATGLNASVNDGKISISDDLNRKITIGSSSDTSNFAAISSLVPQDDGSYQSYNRISKINLSEALTSETSGFENIENGSFKIGDATFEITDKTTMKSLISEINASEDANANAYWDAAAGELVLTSKTEGSFNLNIENLSGNFTDVVGLTTSTYDGEGNVVSSALRDGTQSLGDFALLSINGTTMVSSSNTVTSDISGIEGLTLSLKSVTKPDTEGNINSTKINIEQDTTELMTAVKDFLTEFNSTISKVDTNTASGASLYGETSLNSIRNNLRTTVTASDRGSSVYNVLSQIGISTGKATNSVSTEVNKLELDESQFLEALSKNPDGVKALLVGGDGNQGVLTKLENIVESATASGNGYFSARTSSLETSIKNMSNSITSAQTKVDAYKTRLETQFTTMETMIAKLQQQYSGFMSA